MRAVKHHARPPPRTHTHIYTSWGRELHTPGTDGRTARLLGRQSPGVRKSFPARCPTHSQLLTYPHRTRALTHSLTHRRGERERKRAHTLSIRRQLDTLPRHPPSFSKTKKPPPSPPSVPLPIQAPKPCRLQRPSNTRFLPLSRGEREKNGGTHPTTARMRARPLRGDVGGGGTYVGDMPGAYGQVWEQTREVVVLSCPSRPSLLKVLLACRGPEPRETQKRSRFAQQTSSPSPSHPSSPTHSLTPPFSLSRKVSLPPSHFH